MEAAHVSQSKKTQIYADATKANLYWVLIFPYITFLFSWFECWDCKLSRQGYILLQEYRTCHAHWLQI